MLLTETLDDFNLGTFNSQIFGMITGWIIPENKKSNNAKSTVII